MTTDRPAPVIPNTARLKLTTQILVWMSQQDDEISPSHWAREIAEGIGASVRSTAQGLSLLAARGQVKRLPCKNNPMLYFITASGIERAEAISA